MRVFRSDKLSSIELIKIFTKKNIPEKFHESLVNYYNEDYDVNYDLSEEHCMIYYPKFSTMEFEYYYTVSEDTLEITLDYSEKILEQINIGHSVKWSYLVADNHIGGEQALFKAYHKLKFDNPELAKEELLIHCKFLNADEIFTNYLFIVFDKKLDIEHPIQRTKDYENCYNEQIELGKSAIYAHQFADLFISKKYTEEYCKSFANRIEWEIKEGKSVIKATLDASQFLDSKKSGYRNLKDYIFHHFNDSECKSLKFDKDTKPKFGK
jgi:hypothetical protein